MTLGIYSTSYCKFGIVGMKIPVYKKNTYKTSARAASPHFNSEFHVNSPLSPSNKEYPTFCPTSSFDKEVDFLDTTTFKNTTLRMDRPNQELPHYGN